MVLPSLGAISLSNIQGEFGGQNPIQLSEYFKNAITQYTMNVSDIPSFGGAISLGTFFGKKKLIILVPVMEPSDYALKLVASSDSVLRSNNLVGMWAPSGVNLSTGIIRFGPGGSKPTYYNSGGGTGQGLPYIEFNGGSTEFLQTLNAFNVDLTYGRGLTIVFLVKYTDDALDNTRVFSGTGYGGTVEIMKSSGSRNTANISEVNASVSGGGFCPLNTWVVQALRYYTGACDFFSGSITNKLTQTNPSSLPTNMGLSLQTFIGKDSFKGQLNFFTLYNRALTDAELDGLVSANVAANGITSGAMYPPLRLSSNSHTVSGHAYGNGTYTCSASSIYSTTWDAYMGYNYSTDINLCWSSVFAYNSAYNPSYIGTFTTTSSGVVFRGEWNQIKLPNSITLQGYKLFPPRYPAYFTSDCPQTWVLCGSSDGTTWNTIHIQDTAVIANNGSPSSFMYSVNPGTPYNHYRIVILTIRGGGYAMFAMLHLFGVS